MTLIEICAVIVTVFMAGEKLTGIVANLKQALLLKKVEREFDSLKASIGFGATAGAGLGALLAGVLGAVLNKRGKDAQPDLGRDAKRKD